MQTYGAVCKLLGAFLEPSALWAQLKAALDAECAMDPGAFPKGARVEWKNWEFSWEKWRKLGDLW